MCSSDLENPEVAIKLLEKTHTDQRYYDLLVYGVLGENYIMSFEKISHENIPSENRYPGWTAAGDEVLGYESMPINREWHENVYAKHVEAVNEKVDTLTYFPLDGFILDTTNVLKEVKEMEAIKEKYFKVLLCGVTECLEEDLETANLMLHEVGIERYVEEVKKQLKGFSELVEK